MEMGDYDREQDGVPAERECRLDGDRDADFDRYRYTGHLDRESASSDGGWDGQWRPSGHDGKVIEGRNGAGQCRPLQRECRGRGGGWGDGDKYGMGETLSVLRGRV